MKHFADWMNYAPAAQIHSNASLWRKKNKFLGDGVILRQTSFAQILRSISPIWNTKTLLWIFQ